MAATIANADEEDLLEEVIVLGQKDQLPYEVKVDAPSLIQRELWQELPGIYMDSHGGRGGVTAVRVRGGEADHLLVIRDGVKMNDLSGVNWSVPFAGSATRALFLPGVQGANESEAASGVLSLTTPVPTQSSLTVEGGGGDRHYVYRTELTGRNDSAFFAIAGDKEVNEGVVSSRVDDAERDGYSYDDLRLRLGYGKQEKPRGLQIDSALEEAGGWVEYDHGVSYWKRGLARAETSLRGYKVAAYTLRSRWHHEAPGAFPTYAAVDSSRSQLSIAGAWRGVDFTGGWEREEYSQNRQTSLGEDCRWGLPGNAATCRMEPLDIYFLAVGTGHKGWNVRLRRDWTLPSRNAITTGSATGRKAPGFKYSRIPERAREGRRHSSWQAGRASGPTRSCDPNSPRATKPVFRSSNEIPP